MNCITESNEQSYREQILKLASRYKAKILLDLGCWDGKFSHQVADMIKAKQVWGLDHSNEARKKFGDIFDNFFLGDLNQPLPLENGSVDMVLANQVIEHIAKTDLFVKEIYRVLKPGGHVILATPNLASWHNIGALVLGFQPFASQISDEKFIGNPLHPMNGKEIKEEQAHLRLFTHYSLGELLKIHGFKINEKIGAGYYPLKGKVADLMAKFDKKHSAYIILSAKKCY